MDSPEPRATETRATETRASETVQDTPPPTPRADRATAGSRLRAKLPEVLLEAASVVFAVLLALGVDEWRETRARRESALRARESILREVRANREDLESTRRDTERRLGVMAAQIAALKRGGVKSLDTGIQLAQLSSAAWQTSQSTQATQLLDFDWLVHVARVYETQRLFVELQNNLVPSLNDIHTAETDAQRRVIMTVLDARIRTLHDLAGQLAKLYAELEATERRPSSAPGR